MKKKLSLIIMLLMSSVSVQYALTKSDPFLEGDWREGERSLYCSSRIEVDLYRSLLTISSNTLRSDVTIRISQNDETMFEQTVPSSETERITIDLSNFGTGSCFLELTNQWGDYLYGHLYLE